MRVAPLNVSSAGQNLKRFEGDIVTIDRMFSSLLKNLPKYSRGMSALVDTPGLLSVLKDNQKRLNRIRFLGKLFEAEGFELRIAGGAVRDIIRGKEPKDIDFATTARPEQSLEILRPHEDLVRIIVTAAGQRHGTVAVKFKEVEIDFKRVKLETKPECKKELKEPTYDDESPYEITTLRCDKFTDGRHAEVEFINDWHKDAERRDLTINAMFLTLDQGKLIDYFNGEEDLKRGIVRFVGDADQRMKEDYLRILRYFRFWSRYGEQKPDSTTLDKIRSNLDGLNQISGERIWVEIKKIFSHLPCRPAAELILNLQLLNYAGLKHDDINEYEAYSKEVLNELNVVQENVMKFKKTIVDSDSVEAKRILDLLPVILFATSIRTDSLCLNAQKRLKFSNLERDIIIYIVQNRFISPSLKSMKYQLFMSQASERPAMLQRMRAFLIYKGDFDLIQELASWRVPELPISGSDVVKEIKKRRLPPKEARFVIQDLKEQWSRDDYNTTREELNEQMIQKLKKMSSAAS